MRYSDKKTGDEVSSGLYEAIRNGDEAAFAEYYEGVQGSLIHFITRLTGDKAEAVNIAHDAFIKLWENREQIDRFNGFVYTAATNTSLNMLKRRQVHAKYVSEQMFTKDGETASADQPIIYDELLTSIENIIEKMPPQRRRIFKMSRDESMTYQEIADRLHISYNTVKDHMQSALRELRQTVTTVAILFLLGWH